MANDDALSENNLELPVIQKNDGCLQTGYNRVRICHIYFQPKFSCMWCLHTYSSSQATEMGSR